MSKLELQLVGSPKVVNDGQVLLQLPDKAVALLGYLAIEGASASRSLLAGLLWSDLPEDRARGNLRTTLSRLRRLAPGTVGANRALVWLEPGYWADTDDVAAVEVEKLTALCRGSLLQGLNLAGAELFDSWLASEETRLRSAVLGRLMGAAEAAIEAASAEGDRRCVALCRAMARIAPWNERVERLLIAGLVRTAGRLSALREFDVFRDRLRDELAVEPEAETLALVATLRTRRPDDMAAAWSTVIDLRPIADEVSDAKHGPRLRRANRTVVARDEHLCELLGLLKPEQSSTSTLIVGGPADSGKSALLETFACEARSRGGEVLLTLAGTAGLTLFKDIERVAGTGRLTTEPSGRTIDALVDALQDHAESRPLIVVIDDAHLGSREFLAALPRFATRLRNAGVGLTVAHRSEKTDYPLAFRAALASLDRAGARRLPLLCRLTRSESDHLVRGLSCGLDQRLVDKVADHVWVTTQGLPGYATPWARHLIAWYTSVEHIQVQSRGQGNRAQEPQPTIPQPLCDRIGSRLHSLGPAAFRVANTMALVGGQTDLRTLADNCTSEPLEHVLGGVERLIAAEILTEPDEKLQMRFVAPIIAQSLVEQAGWSARNRYRVPSELARHRRATGVQPSFALSNHRLHSLDENAQTASVRVL